MKPFEVGERVRIFDGCGDNGYSSDGHVDEVRDDGMLYILLDNALVMFAHPKQCRRLIKRGSRVKVSGWMNIYPENGQSILCPDSHTADAAAFPNRIACVRLVGFYTPKEK